MTTSYQQPQFVAAPGDADPPEAVVRRGAQQMRQAALEQEVAHL